ncbi:Endo-1,4-beta-xylanase A [Ananas comosus]|uniref:Endo-1,4-beta-xylanase A n=1 Tax=Ananas comosus TaxID=4615 RepID=A0A199UMA4_ANACO|nr:Endo-1,4-beta-xylanase A [Ananas comosus]
MKDPFHGVRCKSEPEAPLYNGGILMDGSAYTQLTSFKTATGVYSSAFLFYNLTESTRYSFSCWVKIGSTNSTVVKARLTSDNKTSNCIGTTIAQSGCWSFLKGGFVLDASSKTSVIYFQNATFTQKSTIISVKGVSLQQFSEEQWNLHQEDSIRQVRPSHLSSYKKEILDISYGLIGSDRPLFMWPAFKGVALQEQTSRSDRSRRIFHLEWFVERFNAAVFENELKWYATEPVRGKVNYTVADMMLEFIHRNQITVRGHNIFWENPKVTPSWVRNLTGDDLRAAVESRIQSLLSRYKGDFVHWDVNNEMLHFDFYEQRLGPNATLDFFRTAMKVDPLATLFMNEFSVVETCEDVESMVDSYILKLKELNDGPEPGLLEGIGLQGHFAKPNIPLMRAVLDKLATLQLPIWLTEVGERYTEMADTFNAFNDDVRSMEESVATASEAKGGGGHRDPGGAKGHKPNHDARRQRQDPAPPPANISCCVCGENHWARDCPKRSNHKGKQVAAVQAAEGEDDDVVELPRMGALSLVNAVRGQPSGDKLRRRELMFVDVILNGRTTRAMIDTGATHNFVAEAEAKRLGLTLEKDARRIKAVNSELRPIAGVAKDVEIAIGPWRGKANLTVGPLDDFGVILGMDFLVSSKATPMPHLWVLSFMDESAPCMVPMCRGKPTKDPTLTALQLCEGVKCWKAKELEEEDLSSGETVKSHVVLKQCPRGPKGVLRLGGMRVRVAEDMHILHTVALVHMLRGARR